MFITSCVNFLVAFKGLDVWFLSPPLYIEFYQILVICFDIMTVLIWNIYYINQLINRLKFQHNRNYDDSLKFIMMFLSCYIFLGLWSHLILYSFSSISFKCIMIFLYISYRTSLGAQWLIKVRSVRRNTYKLLSLLYRMFGSWKTAHLVWRRGRAV